ncbi:2-oxoglutarate dehydrogenase, E2 component, dihydrolipoamide succinyltransferase [Streptomyces sp. NP160]|uniref:2-oxoglutarate dehydrogenase, E2 component, dihydrolipoamide succinyltransferase n=1 Tax=Streptomyces sp. NP160 TaxID=2586637 RepID=UPI001117CB77|nr:2-oxoglutarate dehydrogenase, E2 component, dihydrolipoamide succinyltransferase [Streptomyces sp. NP160]TNM68331.1 2-oxoglutarate dehydrogenase, E2 component, dihydrolipoamide succinyltransferase [Streptomyces sp. NP160]
MPSVEMPALGESVTEGTVTRWLKSVGDTVEVDEPLLEVSTDKVDTEIPSPFAGTLTEILVQEDDTAEVGAALAVIGDASEGTSSGSSSGGASEPEPQPEPEPEPEEAPAPQAEAPKSSGGASGGGGSQAVTMPALGESVTEGTVTRWLKSVGDTVEVDEPLLEVSTDKVDTEIPSPFAGTLTEILVQEDETAEVGAELARVGSGSGGSDSSDSAGSGGEEGADRAAGSLADEVEEREKAEQQAMDTESGSSSSSSPSSSSQQSSSKPSQQDVPDRQVAPEAPATASGAEQASEDYNSPAPQTGGGVTPPVDPGRTAPKAPADVSAYVTPLVRKLAANEGVDLSTVTGTGVGGRIRKEDVLKAAEAAKAKAAPAPAAPSSSSSSSSAPKAPAAPSISAKRGTTEKMSRLRKVIAQRMVESLQVSAQLTTVVEVDVTRIAKLRERAKDAFKAREGASLSYLPFITLAAVEALKQYPQVNASIEGESIVYHPQENIGIAVDTERGLLVPVVKDAGDLNLAGIARKIGDLAKRTRDNKVTPDELGGGTFTITNTGSRGALFDTPIINQPQVAILGTGAVVKRPAVVTGPDGDDVIAVRSMMYLALSYDHRLVDGADAARFLVALKARLEDGAFEAELGL